MNILLLGGGGREHAIAASLRRSPRLRNLLILPGNAGTAALGENIPGDPTDISHVLEVIRREDIDLTIIGPEDPLAAGVADAIEQTGGLVFGPRREAARLEFDKGFAKHLMRQAAVPTAEWREFSDFGQARHYIASRDEALVVKAVGLARGKGVIVCADPADAILAAEKILVDRIFGSAGERIIVEERLNGREVSLLALVDERTIYLLEPAQDYKRLGDGDTGPNTGGMGSFSPTPLLTPQIARQVETQILIPMLDALLREEIPYRGVLYVGLMLTPGGPKVLEFNCRMGDPETQALLPRVRSDLVDVTEAVARSRLVDVDLQWDPRPAVCVVLASAGYPGTPQVGQPISGLREAAALPDTHVFHAATQIERGRVISSGGRVLCATGLGQTLELARQRAYAAADLLIFEGRQMRRDIAD